MIQLKRYKLWWKHYRYRFLPWIIFTWKNRTVRLMPKEVDNKQDKLTDSDISKSLEQLFAVLKMQGDKHHSSIKNDTQALQSSYKLRHSDETVPHARLKRQFLDSPSVKSSQHNGEATSVPTKEFQCRNHDNSTWQSGTNLDNRTHDHDFGEELHYRNLDVMKQYLGFTIQRQQSGLKDGGTGVFVTAGEVPPKSVAAMYPGVVYLPGEPILLQSFGNPFIFRCLDGQHIDGSDKRISKYLYRSCSQRDRIGPYFTSDMSWLTPYPQNPLAIGQYVNNQNKDKTANVAYQEFDVPIDFPFKLRSYIPNVNYSASFADVRLMRTVVLVSLRTIHEGEELFSSYFTMVYGS